MIDRWWLFGQVQMCPVLIGYKKDNTVETKSPSFVHWSQTISKIGHRGSEDSTQEQNQILARELRKYISISCTVT